MKVKDLIHSLTGEVALDADVIFKDCLSCQDLKVTSVGYDEQKKLVYINNAYDTDLLRARWHSVDDYLPPYGESVIVHLKNGSRCMTNRTKKDYSKDKNDFVHVSIADDADYWIEIPEFS